MIPWTAFLWLAVGFAGVTIGADVFVGGASGIARRLGVSPLLVGLTIVALGTSAPEVAVNVTAALRNQTDMAIGNVLGSNILNILGVLGLSALLQAIVIDRQLVRLDVPVMVGAAVLLGLFAWNGRVDAFEASILVLALIAYTAVQVFLAVRSRRSKSDQEQGDGDARPVPLRVAQLIAGVALLVAGSDRLVLGATDVARWWGLSDLVIGLTVIAVGTSLPEIATSVAATLRGQGELAVGNVVGSNIYNILAVVGLTGIVSQGGLPVSAAALAFDLPVMIAACLACLPIFYTGRRIDRWEGGLFLAYYATYVAYLLLMTQHHALADPLGRIMLYIVVPITVVTLLVMTVLHLRESLAAGRAGAYRAGAYATDGGPSATSSATGGAGATSAGSPSGAGPAAGAASAVAAPLSSLAAASRSPSTPAFKSGASSEPSTPSVQSPTPAFKSSAASEPPTPSPASPSLPSSDSRPSPPAGGAADRPG